MENLTQEKYVREVEVSIWETANAVAQYMDFPTQNSLREYQKQIKKVNEYWKRYSDIATPEESSVIEKFKNNWNLTTQYADEIIKLKDQLVEHEREFNNKIHTIDDVIDYKIQTKFITGTKNLIKKEQAVREVEVSLWEIANAVNLYIKTNSQEDKDEYLKQIREVDEYFSKYKKLERGTAALRAIREFEQLYNDVKERSKNLSTLSQELFSKLDVFNKKIHEVDSIIDYEVQEAIFSKKISENYAIGSAQIANISQSLGIGLAIFIVSFFWVLLYIYNQSKFLRKNENNNILDDFNQTA